MNPEMKEDEAMKMEFRGVLILLLDLLEHGDFERAKEAIEKILADK